MDKITSQTFPFPRFFHRIIIQFYKTVLHLATQIGNAEIVKLLLGMKGIDINIEDSQMKKPIDYTKNDAIKQLFC